MDNLSDLEKVATFVHYDDLHVIFYRNKDGYYNVAVHIPSTNHTVLQGYTHVRGWIKRLDESDNWEPVDCPLDSLQAIRLDLELSDQPARYPEKERGDDY